MICVFIISHFYTTLLAPIMPVNILCSDMTSCVKDSPGVADSVNIEQNALNGMVRSKLALYAQKIAIFCNLFLV